MNRKGYIDGSIKSSLPLAEKCDRRALDLLNNLVDMSY